MSMPLTRYLLRMTHIFGKSVFAYLLNYAQNGNPVIIG